MNFEKMNEEKTKRMMITPTPELRKAIDEVAKTNGVKPATAVIIMLNQFLLMVEQQKGLMSAYKKLATMDEQTVIEELRNDLKSLKAQ